jgi:hypothetical protein
VYLWWMTASAEDGDRYLFIVFLLRFCLLDFVVWWVEILKEEVFFVIEISSSASHQLHLLHSSAYSYTQSSRRLISSDLLTLTSHFTSLA